VNVSFPAGIEAGQRLRVPGQGMAAQGSAPGDLFVEVDVEGDPRFERDGADLVARVGVAFVDAALGAEIRVPALEPDANESSLTLSVPPGTQSGAVFTLKGHGVPRLDGRGRGSLVIVAQVEVPTSLSPRARELLQRLGEELGAGSGAARRVASAE
jgi:molecular chaperone DnaJ